MDIVRYLLGRSVDVNAREPGGGEYLRQVASDQNDHSRTPGSVGADNEGLPEPDTFYFSWSSTASGGTPLFWAAAAGHAHVVELLLEHGAGPELATSTGMTPPLAAAENGQTGAVAVLLRHGANVNATDTRRQTALTLAAECDSYRNRANVLRLLLKAGADPNRGANRYGDDYNSPLVMAATAGYLDALQIRLDAGASPLMNANEGGRLFLLVARAQEPAPLIKALFAHGAKPYYVDDDGNTPLHKLAYGDSVSVMLLLSAGLRADSRTRRGLFPLAVAAQCGTAWAIRVLIRRGASVNAATPEGATALHVACYEGNREAAQALIDAGASVTAVTTDMTTPLHAAAHSGDTTIARLLLKHHAIVGIRDLKGMSPLMLTEQYGHYDLVALLKMHGAK